MSRHRIDEPTRSTRSTGQRIGQLEEREALWQKMREFAPDEGAKRRVLEAVEPRLRQQSPRRVLVPVFAAAAAAALIVFWLDGPGRNTESVESAPAEMRVVTATGAQRDGATIARGQTLDPGAIEVADVGHVTVANQAARIDVSGPALVSLGERKVVVDRGQLTVEGEFAVEGPTCTAHVHGRSAVSVSDARLEVRVLSGSVELSKPSVDCQVIELEDRPSASAESAQSASDSVSVPPAAPAPPQPALALKGEGEGEGEGESQFEVGRAVGSDERQSPTVAKATRAGDGTRRPARAAESNGEARERAADQPEPQPTSPASPAASELSRQVDAYWAAVRLRDRDPNRALRDLRAMIQTWPASSLRPEIELAIFDTLVALGRSEAAGRQARKILERYPNTPRAGELGHAARGVGDE